MGETLFAATPKLKQQISFSKFNAKENQSREKERFANIQTRDAILFLFREVRFHAQVTKLEF